MTADDRRWPFALEEVTGSLLRILETEGDQPERIEIVFGAGVLEILQTADGLLRQLTVVTAFGGVPVKYPERPGTREFILDVTVVGGALRQTVGVHVSIVVASACRRR